MMPFALFKWLEISSKSWPKWSPFCTSFDRMSKPKLMKKSLSGVHECHWKTNGETKLADLNQLAKGRHLIVNRMRLRPLPLSILFTLCGHSGFAPTAWSVWLSLLGVGRWGNPTVGAHLSTPWWWLLGDWIFADDDTLDFGSLTTFLTHSKPLHWSALSFCYEYHSLFH